MTVSIWQDSAAWPGEVDHQQLTADVCIIGGGIVGSLIATLLVEAGKDIVVLEAGYVGGGASGRNAGHCIAGFRDNYHLAIERLGHDVARATREEFVMSRQWIAELCERHDVPFEANGSRYLGIDERECERLRASYDALARDGQVVEWADTDPWNRGFHGMILQQGDLGLQPYLLVSRVMANSGAHLIETSEVRRITQGASKVTVESRRATVECDQAVLATNAYSRILHPFFRDRVHPIRGQAYATEPASERLFDGPTGANDGFEYFRQLPDRRFIIGGYRDVYPEEEVGYGDETTPHLQAGLREWIAQRFPEVADLAITHRWAGIMGFTDDGLPLIGRLPDMDRVAFCVGFNGGGMSMGPAAARRLVGMLLDGAPLGPFDAGRTV